MALEYADAALQKLEPYPPLTAAVQELLAGDALSWLPEDDEAPGRARRAAKRLEVLTRLMAHQRGKDLAEPHPDRPKSPR